MPPDHLSFTNNRLHFGHPQKTTEARPASAKAEQTAPHSSKARKVSHRVGSKRTNSVQPNAATQSTTCIVNSHAGEMNCRRKPQSPCHREEMSAAHRGDACYRAPKGSRRRKQIEAKLTLCWQRSTADDWNRYPAALTTGLTIRMKACSARDIDLVQQLPC